MDFTFHLEICTHIHMYGHIFVEMLEFIGIHFFTTEYFCLDVRASSKFFVLEHQYRPASLTVVALRAIIHAQAW